MSTVVVPSSAPALPPAESEDYSRVRLITGIVGRTWLWFLAGCLLVTLVPILFGWRPYVVESDSMAPRIKAGDVVLSAPIPTAAATDLVGHVITFDDPNIAGRVLTHRVVSVTEDGTLRTKGDANGQQDSQPVAMASVRGLGRLLVRYVGLPFIWVHDGAWLWLGLFLASLFLAGWAVSRDREEELPESPDPDDWGGDDRPAAGAPTAPSSALAGATGAPEATSSTSFRLAPLTTQLGLRLATRTGIVFGLSLLLILPSTAAAFSATTKNAGNKWSVPIYSYTDEANQLGPYLYWKFDETGTATAAADDSGNNHPGRYNSNGSTTYFTRLTDGALVNETPDRAVQLNNASSCINTASATLITSPAQTSVVIWFKTSSSYSSGGKLAGFEKPQTGVAAPSTGTYDRHLYMDGTGYVWFGVYNSGYVTLRSTTTLNDGAWHMAVGTVGPAGTRLYIDGSQVASNAGNTAAESTTGVWRAGCGNLGGWGGSWNGGNSPGTDSSNPANRVFLGGLDEFTVYTSQLSAADVGFLYFVH